MTILQSIILGIVEGITEFLPISSTGHLILAGDLLNIPESDFLKSFEIIIQLGAISSVIYLYWKTLWNIETIKKLVVGFIPTGIIGLLLYKTIKSYLLGNQAVVVWALLLGGIAIVIFEYFYKKQNLKEDQEEGVSGISYRQAFLVGVFQSLAVIPGVSRSAATILGGLSLGLSRTLIVRFSFLLAVPTILAASGLDLIKNHSVLSGNEWAVLAFGFLTSFIVALFSIKFLLRFIKNHSFMPFGIYRILIGLLFILIIF